MARVIGPTIAAVLIATVGIAWCFIIDGVSYFAVLAVLLAMRVSELHPAPRAGRHRGQLREGLRYVVSTPILSAILLMMALIGTFTYEFTVSLPVFSETSFGGGAAAYAAMTAAMGLGSVVGGLVAASQAMRSPVQITLIAAWFGVAVLLTALAPTLTLALVALLGVGYFSIQFTAQANATLQIESEPSMRGRVMALWAMAFLGSTPVGGPIIGAIAEHIGPRWALTVGAITALAAAALGAYILRRRLGIMASATSHLP
jgi:predicted MFS family arabinose efflux permease